MPNYMLLLYDDPSQWANVSPEEMQAAIAKYGAWTQKPFVVDHKRLAEDPGKVIRGSGAKARATDGPYSETKEVLGAAHVGLAEDAVQEAMLRALRTWPYEGTPENAAAWLFRVAHNVAIDALRRERLLGEKTEAVVAEFTRSAATPVDPGAEEQLRDDELRMMFMCCHPALSRDVSV